MEYPDHQRLPLVVPFNSSFHLAYSSSKGLKMDCFAQRPDRLPPSFHGATRQMDPKFQSHSLIFPMTRRNSQNSWIVRSDRLRQWPPFILEQLRATESLSLKFGRLILIHRSLFFWLPLFPSKLNQDSPKKAAMPIKRVLGPAQDLLRLLHLQDSVSPPRSAWFQILGPFVLVS